MKRKIYLNKVSLEEAKEKYLKLFTGQYLPGEKIPVTEAVDRVTAEPVFARRSAPGYFASAMDGIAVKAADTARASERSPVILKKGEQGIPVDTGDSIPAGFNAVIRIEEVTGTEAGNYQIEKGVTPWHNVRSPGESVVKGQMVLPVNHRLKAQDLGALLESGINEIMVRKKPVIGIIPTGTELVPPDVEPQRGQLTEFNSVMLSSLMTGWGAAVHTTRIVPDNYNEIKDTFLKEHANNDITVIIAGSSAGREDYTVKILEENGEVLVHGINIMPGKPVILAVVDNKPVIGLPGYPIAALLNCWLFIRPLITGFLGLNPPALPQVEAILKRKLPSQIGLKEFIRVNLAEVEGKLIAVPGERGSAAMLSLLRADGIGVVPEQREGFSPGAKIPVYILNQDTDIYRNLLFSGSHDLTLEIIVNIIRERCLDFDLKLQSTGSMGGIMALKREEAHLAGAHLLDEETGEYNISYIKKYLPGRKMAVINLVNRQQGLFVPRGNPKNIVSIKDLQREDVVFLNRQRGAGTRVLLDYWLKKEKISPQSIKGYEREEYTHIKTAAAVSNGSADTALGIKAAATALDLDFIPLLEECYDIILPKKMLTDERIQVLTSIIRSKEFKDRVEKTGGYSTANSGEVKIIE